MAIDKTQLLTALREASELVEAAAAGQMSIPAFIERYQNFYYAAALDGHEEEPELLDLIRSNPEFVRIHEETQREVVNATYLGPVQDPESLRSGGRITVEEAEARLRTIASRHQLTKLLRARF
ncbi:MAG: hypothetical protein ACREMO_04985 [Gemmatimonadales bacterium]